MSVVPTTRETLAVKGGTPVRKTLLPYGKQSIDDDDVDAVVAVLRSDWMTTGPKVAEFEEAFAARVGSKYAVSFSSGTSALHGAAFADLRCDCKLRALPGSTSGLCGYTTRLHEHRSGGDSAPNWL